jgi:hypothetical protein
VHFLAAIADAVVYFIAAITVAVVYFTVVVTVPCTLGWPSCERV